MHIYSLIFAFSLSITVSSLGTPNGAIESLKTLESLIIQARLKQSDILETRVSGSDKRGETCTPEKLVVRRAWSVSKKITRVRWG